MSKEFNFELHKKLCIDCIISIQNKIIKYHEGGFIYKLKNFIYGDFDLMESKILILQYQSELLTYKKIQDETK